jgi:hypothetical protein
LEDIEEYAEEFGTMLGNYPNIRALAEMLNRERNKINIATKNARVAYEHALKTHRELTTQQVQELDIVRKARLKAEGIKDETAPIVADLEQRLRKCQTFLLKYQ